MSSRARDLTAIGDDLGETRDMVECVFYAAGSIGDSTQVNAMQSVLHLISQKIEAIKLEIYAMEKAG